MEGILKEGVETMDELDGQVLDAALISAAQRVEHYEIAACGTVCAYAELLGRHEDLGPLREALEEEKQADEKLTELSKTISREALGDPAQESKVSSRPATKATLRLRKHRPAA
jgi:ferritin-like metal-binding protein YciE